MYCEIRKVGFINKGAELMLLAAVEQLSARCPDLKLVMKAGRNNSHEPYLSRAKLGLFQKPWAWKGEYQLGDLFKYMPEKYRDMFGIVLDKELDIVLDGSGFSYSDQWGVKAIKELVRSAERWKKNGTKLIMLPQAFGPFGDELKPYAKRFIELADIVYVRDEVSLKHMREIAGDIEKIKLSPDFTNLVEPSRSGLEDSLRGKISIVPNYRMVDKGENSSESSYLKFMVASVKHLFASGEQPYLLVHEGEKDLMLAKQIQSQIPGIEIITESDPLKIKSIIGVSKALVGSRFHSLVSALSMGVPVLATGWSHKYEMLLADYGIEGSLLDVHADENTLKSKLELIVNKVEYDRTKETIVAKSNVIKQNVTLMWNEIESFIVRSE